MVVNTGKILDFQLGVVLEKIEGVEIIVAAPIFFTLCIISNSTYTSAIIAIPGDPVIVTVMAFHEVVVASGLSIECFAGVASPPVLEITLGLVNFTCKLLDGFFYFFYNALVSHVKILGWVGLEGFFHVLNFTIHLFDLVLQGWLVVLISVFVTVGRCHSFHSVLIAVIRQVGSSRLYRDFLCVNGTSCGSVWVGQRHVG